MEGHRRMSSQGNEAMSHHLRRCASVEYERRLMNQGRGIWLLYRISINVCVERNSESESQQRISHKRGEVNNGKEKVRASYCNKKYSDSKNCSNAW